MFDVAWQEILVIGIVALIVVGPKELPTLLRTVGKYIGLIKRQAGEFRAQFDEAMRESELDQLKKDVEKIKDDAENTLRDVERSVDTEIGGVKREFDETARGITASGNDPSAMHDANGVPFAGTPEPSPVPQVSNGAGAAAIAAAAAAAPPPSSAAPSGAAVAPAKADA